MHLETIILETSRLILRPFKVEDADAMYHNWASDPEATRFMTFPPYQSVEDAAAFLSGVMKHYEQKDACIWAITLKESGVVIGSLGAFVRSEAARSVKVGYIIGKAWWHQGYTSEALAAVIDNLFTHTEVRRIEAQHDPRNPNSGAVMRKCGMQYEGTHVASDRNNTGVCDMMAYAILKDAYQSHRSGQECGLRLKTKVLETQRLILRPFKVEDADSVFHNWASDPEATRYMSWPTHQSLADSRAYIAFAMEQYAREQGCEWAIMRKDTGEVIGSLGISVKNEAAKCVNSGYIIGKQWWHQGYTSEAYGAVIRYLFRQTEVRRIEAYHDTRNPHSGAVMRKCGLTYEGTARQAERNNQGICDVATYAILKDEYV